MSDKWDATRLHRNNVSVLKKTRLRLMTSGFCCKTSTCPLTVSVFSSVGASSTAGCSSWKDMFLFLEVMLAIFPTAERLRRLAVCGVVVVGVKMVLV